MATQRSQVLLVFCTCPADGSADKLARVLIEQELAACANILPTARSIYKWQGKIEQQDESVLMIKTTHTAYAKLEQTILENHPYEVPEIIAIPVAEGLNKYLKWVEEVTCTKS